MSVASRLKFGLGGEHDGDTTRAGADIGCPMPLRMGTQPFQGMLDQQFGLWAGNQHLGGNQKIQPIKFPMSKQIRQRLAMLQAC